MADVNESKDVLLPCPFCGGKPIYESKLVVFYPKIRFRCGGCGLRTAWDLEPSAVYKHWNKRVGQ